MKPSVDRPTSIWFLAPQAARIVSTLLVVILASSAPGNWSAPSPSARAAGLPLGSAIVPSSVDDAVLAPPEGVSAQAAFVIDATAGTPLYSLLPDERRAPASLTKIATALVVLDHAPLDDVVTIEASDLVDPSESHIGLVDGDRLTVRSLLYGLLVPSGNDAANALARYVGASLPGGDSAATGDQRAAFIAAMNGLAKAMGLQNTAFLNASGINQEGHFSSARDLATLTGRAMQDSTFAEIVATVKMDLVSEADPNQVYPIATTNDLLLDGTVTGVKTGTTSEAGGCLITSSTINGDLVLSVILGSAIVPDDQGNLKSPARFDDARLILGAIPTDYAWVDPTDPATFEGLDQELSAWRAGLQGRTAVVVPVARRDELRYRVVLGPAGSPDAQVGKVVFLVGNDPLSEQPLFQIAA